MATQVTRTRTVAALFVGICICHTAGPVTAEDWPHWRGSSRTGVVSEPSGWEAGSWPIGEAVWSLKLAAGGSAPIVVDDRIYTIGSNEGTDIVYCLDATAGRELWRQSYDCPLYGRHSTGDQGLYSGPSASPEYDPATGLLYTLSTDGDLNCWDTRNEGERVWTINFYDKYQVGQRPLVGTRLLRDYGYTTSPLIHGDWVIAEVGDDEGNLMAFSKLTGRRQWTSESKDPAGHTGGLAPITVEGLPCVAVLTIHQLLVVRLDEGHEGETLATFPWETDFANSIATPAVSGNSVLITSEYNQYSICRVQITRGGATEVWRQPYASGVCSPVIHKGFVYWGWRGLYCLDFETGRPVWRGGRFGDTASLLAASDDRLIVWADRGDLLLVDTAVRSPDKYQELARRRSIMNSDVWPHVVLAGGRLCLKDRDGNLKVFKL